MNDEGSATVWVLVAALALLCVAAVSGLAGVALTARHRAAAAADAAAIAAALRGPSSVAAACDAARRAAAADGAQLSGCAAGAVSGVPWSVLVRVEVAPPRVLGWLGPAVGLSRAGRTPAQSATCVEGRQRRNLASSPSLC